jgi:hypothetical protein
VELPERGSLPLGESKVQEGETPLADKHWGLILVH